MKLLYTAHAVTTGGRNGHTQTDDKKIDFDLSSPGTNKPGINPEQLFAAGYSACFGSAVEAVAKKYQVPGTVTIKADVNLNTDDQGGYFISVVLDTTIADFTDEAKLGNIVRDAHQMCPYSKATKGNIEVVLKANGKTIS